MVSLDSMALVVTVAALLLPGLCVGSRPWSLAETGRAQSNDTDVQLPQPPFSLQGLQNVYHHHHHHDQYRQHRDRRCKDSECGYVRVCHDTYIGKICYNIYCECDDDTMVQGDTRAYVEEDQQQPSLEVVLSLPQLVNGAGLDRDSRCNKNDCGWIKQCNTTPFGNVCWNIYCHCDNLRDDNVPDLSASEVIIASSSRDAICEPQECGWRDGCSSDELPCRPVFCGCSDSMMPPSELLMLSEVVPAGSSGVAPGASVPPPEALRVDHTSDLDRESFSCRHECRWVERCKTSGPVSLCWPMRCASGCATAADLPVDGPSLLSLSDSRLPAE